MKKLIMISLILLAIFLSSGSALAHRIHFRGWIGPPILSITEGTTHLLSIMSPITTLIAFGSRVTGRRGKLPMDGKGCGSQVTGDTVPDGQRIV